MTAKELRSMIYSSPKPKNWREGQFVFNMIDKLFGVARAVQFEDRVDCFFRDDKIDEFIEKCVERINDKPL